MCVYNGQRVTRAEYIKLKALEKLIKNFSLTEKFINGYDYRDQFILVPTADKKDFEIIPSHWEFLPNFVETEDDFKAFREGPRDPVTRKPLKKRLNGEPNTGYTTLDAKGETLLETPMYAEAALNGRCLIISSNFYDSQSRDKESYPHNITLKEEYMIDGEYFFIAAVGRWWTDKKTGKQMHTHAMSTAPANEKMAEVHNTKMRMPTILPPDEAYEWLLGNPSRRRIKELATYQIPSHWMKAYTIAKDFRTSPTPTKEYVYPERNYLF